MTEHQKRKQPSPVRVPKTAPKSAPERARSSAEWRARLAAAGVPSAVNAYDTATVTPDQVTVTNNGTGVNGGLQLYAYVAGNPMHYADPSGEAPEPKLQVEAASGFDPAKKYVNSDTYERDFYYKASAMEAAEMTLTVPEKHEKALEERGVGLFFGTKSWYAVTGKNPDNLEEMNCILYQMMPVEAHVRYLESVGELPEGTWESVRAATEDGRGPRLTERGEEEPNSDVPVGRDTVLMQKLREKVGYKTVLVDRGQMLFGVSLPKAVKAAGGMYPPKVKTVRGADSSQPIDVRTKIDRVFKNTKADRAAALEYLSSLPFAIVTQEYGYHTLVLSFGKVYEAHWETEPTECGAMFEATPLADYLKTQPHVTFAVPPGYEPPN